MAKRNVPATPIRHPARVKPSVTVAEVVISGSFRKDPKGLTCAYKELTDLGSKILSPKSARAVKEFDGFVFMEGEEHESPDRIEARHLDSIRQSQFVWLHAPEGYVGVSAALEIGFANANGIPVYARNQLSDPVLRPFVHVVPSPRNVVSDIKLHRLPIPQPALQAFQSYYRRVAGQRGYDNETAQNCLLLMVEEIGELAKAIRGRSKLKRHGPRISRDESMELADVFMYVVHLANVLGISLADIVQQKELINLRRFLKQ